MAQEQQEPFTTFGISYEKSWTASHLKDLHVYSLQHIYAHRKRYSAEGYEAYFAH